MSKPVISSNSLIDARKGGSGTCGVSPRLSRRRKTPIIVAAALASVATLLAGSTARAATDTWTGLGGTTDWLTTGNWTYSSGTGPVAGGDSLIFTSANGSGSNTLTDTLTNSAFNIANITFNSGALAYTMTGNTFTLISGMTNSSASLQTFSNTGGLDASSATETFAFTSTAGISITTGLLNTSAGAQTLTVNGAGQTLTLGGYTLDNNTSGAVTDIINGTGNVTINAPIVDGTVAGSGLTYSGTGILTLSGANTYAGNTNLTSGTMVLTSTGSLQSTGSLATSVPSIFQLGSGSSNVSQTFANLTGNGTVLAGNTGTASVLTINNTGADTFTGVLGSNNSPQNNLALTKTGGGTLVLTNANSYSGATTISNGTLQLQNVLAPPSVLHLSLVNNTVDTSGSSPANNGTLVGAPGYTTGIRGQTYGAISLNGSSQYVSVPDSTSLNITGSYTVSLWEKVNGAQTTATLLSTRYGSDNTFDLQTTANTLHGDIGSGTGWLNTAANANATLGNGWNMITYTVTTGAYSIYLDGTSIGSGTLTAGTPAFMKTGQTLDIGVNGSGGTGLSGYFNGSIAEVSVYNSALSAGQIASLYTYTNTGAYNVLPAASPVSLASGAKLDLNGVSQTVASLSNVAGSGGSVVNNAASTPVTLTLNPASGSTTFAGVIGTDTVANSISLVKTGPGTQIFTNAQTYTGTTTISGGTLTLASTATSAPGGSLPSTSSVALSGAGIFQLGDANGSVSQTVASLTGTGSVVGGYATLASPSVLTIGVNAGSNPFAGVLGGSNATQNNLALTKTGAGTLLLTNASSYTGTTTISQGTLKLGSGSNYAAPTIGAASVSNNATPPSGTLAGASLIAGLLPSSTNGSAGQVGTGGFASGNVAVLTDGQNPTVGGSYPGWYTIGNNAVLTYTLPSSPYGYNISNVNIFSDWQDTGRSQISIASIAYSTVSAPSTFITISGTGDTSAATGFNYEALYSAAGVLASNVYAVQFNFGTQINGWVGYGELQVLGSPVTTNILPVASPVSMAGSTTLDLYGSNQTIASLSGPSTATVTNSGTSNATFTIGGSGTATFSGVIQDGLTKTISLVQSGTVTQTLSGANTYSGGTTVNGGTLSLSTNGTLGLATGTLTVGNSNVGIATATVLNLPTAVASFATGSLNGTIATPTPIGGTNTATINVASGQTFTVNQTTNGSFAGVIAGSTGNFTKSGSGTLTLGGLNAYAGTTAITGGVVKLSTVAALNNQTFTSDAAALIGTTSPYGTTGYTTALAFNQTQTTTPNGSGNVTINGQLFTDTGTATSGTNWSLTGLTNFAASGTFPAGFTLPSTNNSTYSLLNHFDYGAGSGSVETITISGLAAGTTYDARLYYRAWSTTTDTRTATITFGSGSTTALTATPTPLNEDGDANAHYLDYVYTANAAGIMTVSITPPTSSSWHVYGFSNQSIATLLNGTLPANLQSNIPSSSPVTIASGSSLDMNGVLGQTLASLGDAGVGNTGSVINSAAGTTSILALNTSGSASFSGVIGNVGGGTINVSMVGTGVQTLAGTNIYTGTTTVSAGTLVALNASTPLGASSAPLNLNGGTLDIQANGTSYNTTVGGNATIISDSTSSSATTQTLGTLSIGGSTLTVGKGAGLTGTAVLTFSGTTTFTGTPTFSIGTGSLLELGAVTNSTFTGTLTGAGNFAQTGAWGSGTGGITLNSGFSGTATLNQTNTYTGLTTIAGGTLVANNAMTPLGAGTALQLNGGTLDIQANGTAYNTAVGGNATIISDSTSSSATTQTLGTLSIGGSTLTVGKGTGLTGIAGLTFSGTTTFTGTPTFSIATGSLLTLGTVTNSTFTGTLTGAGNFAQTGAWGSGTGGITLNSAFSGTATLNQTNTYTGLTTIAGGTLVANNAMTPLGAGTALQLNGGTLDIQANGTAYNTTVGGNATIISDSTSSSATTQTLGTLSIGGSTLTVGEGTGLTGIAGLAFGNATFTGAPTFSIGTNTLLTLGAVSNSTFTGTLTGSGNLAQTGAWGGGSGGLTLGGGFTGTATLSQANTFTGATAVNGGYLNIQNNSALGTATATMSSGVTVASGAALQIQNNITTTTAVPLSLIGAGPSNNGALENVSGTNVYSGPVTLTGNTTIGSDAGILTLSNPGAITGSGNLTKAGAGTLKLGGVSSYTGSTTITGGTLQLSRVGALAYYPLDGTVGAISSGATVMDVSGNNNNGTLSAAGASYVGGKYNQGIHFNGSQLVSVPYSSSFAGISSYTVNAWVDFANQPANNIAWGIVGTRNASDTVDIKYFNSNGTLKLHADIGNGGGTWYTTAADATETLSLNTWNMVSYTVNGSGYQIYLNGSQIGNGTFSSATPLFMVPGQSLYMGNDYGVGAGEPMTGSEDDVSIFGSSLSAAQVATLYTGTIPGATPVVLGGAGNLDLNGISQTVASLADGTGVGNVINSNATTPVTLTLNTAGSPVTFSGVIGGDTSINSISVSMSGTGTQILAGANTYTGTTTITNGTLNIQNNSALGSSISATVSNNGALQMQGNLTTTTAIPLSLSGSGPTTGGALESVSGSNNYTGLISLGGNATIGVDSGTLNLSNTGTITGNGNTLTLTGAGNGTIASNIGTGTGGLTMNGTGVWTLLGAGTYTGATAVNNGILNIQNNSALGTASGSTSSGVTVASGAALQIQNNVSTSTAVPLALAGAGPTSNGALESVSGTNTFSGPISITGNATIGVTSGSLNLTNTGPITGSGNNLTLTGAGNGSLASPIATGSGNLTKNGSGTWTLLGTSTYGGSTTISQGILKLGTGNVVAGTTSFAGMATSPLATGTTLAGTSLIAGLSPTAVTNGSAGQMGTNPVNSPTGGVGVLTDGLNFGGNSLTSYAHWYTIGSNASLTYTLPASAYGDSISGINIFADWADTGRSQISMASIAYSTTSAPTTFIPISSTSATYANGTNSELSYSSAGGPMAANVYAIQFNFGVQLNGFVGYGGLQVFGGTSILPATTGVTIAANSTLDLSGTSQTIASLTGPSTAIVTNSSLNGVALTLSPASGSTTIYSGTISNGNSTVGLVMNGPGTQLLAGANTYSVATTVNAGTLGIVPSSAGTLGNGSTPLTMGGGTVDLGGTNQSVGAVTITAAASGGANTIQNGTLNGTSYAVSNTSGNAIVSANAGLQGSGGLTMSGVGGTLTLAGTNTYSGLTTVSGGTLQISGTTTTSGVTINGGTNTTVIATNANALGSGQISFATGATTPILDLHVNGGGTIAFPNSLSGNSGLTDTIDVNNNGDSSSNGVIQLNGNPGASGIGNTTLNVTGGNGYSLYIATLLGTAGASGTTTLNPTTASLSLGTVNWAVNSANSDTLDLDGTASGNVITGAIQNSSGTLGITKSNTSTWTLAGANSYTGATAITGGILNIQNSSAFGTGAGATTTGVTVSSGAALQIQGNISTTTAVALSLNGVGPSGNGALENVSGNNTYSGAVTLAGNTTIGSDAGSLALSNTGSTAGGGSLTLAGAGNGSIAGGIVTGSGSVTMNGGGTWTLSGGNTYSGATTINSGTLKLAPISTPVGIANAGFEAPVQATHGFTYTPAGAGWTFLPNPNTTNGAGIAANGSPWYAPNTPQGVQAGYVQALGSISQTITVNNAGTYTFSFIAVGRTGHASDNLNVTIDGNTVVTVPDNLGTTSWTTFTDTVNLSGGSHTIAFTGIDTLGGDFDTAIDNVALAPINAGPLPYTTAVNLTTSGATLDIGNTLQAVASLNGVAGTSVVGSGTLTFGDSTSPTFPGVISGSVSLVKQGSGNVTFSASNQYTGSTTVSAGTLTLTASLANTATTVASGATLAVSGANPSIGTITGTTGLTIAGGGTLTTLGTGGSNNTTLSLNSTAASTALTMGGTAGNPSFLNMNLGDLISAQGLISIGAGGVQFNLTGTPTGSSQTLITTTAANGLTLAGGNSSLVFASTGSGSEMFDGYILELASNANSIYLNEALNQPLAYWVGTSNTWSTAGNWSSSPSGSPLLAAAPNFTSDVFFTANSAGNLSSTVDANLTINSLTFTGTGTPATAAIAIGGTNTLTILAAASQTGGAGYSAGTGIMIMPGTGAVTITAPVTLGSSQTWTNASSNTFTAGAISTSTGTSPYILTTAGSGNMTFAGPISGPGGLAIGITGTTVLSGTNSYSGPTTLTGSTLILSNSAALGSTSNFTITGTPTIQSTVAGFTLGSSSAVTVGSSWTASGSNSMTFNGALTATASSTITDAITGGNGLTLGGTVNLSNTSTGHTLTFNGAAPTVVSGNIVNGGSAAGGVTYSGTNTLTLSGSNSFSGALTLTSGGTVILSGNNIGRPANAGSQTVIPSGAVLQLQAYPTNTVAGTSYALSTEATSLAYQPFIIDSGGTLQLRSDSTLTFAGGYNFGGLGSATVTFDVNNITPGNMNNTLTFAPGGFATGNTTFNVTGGNGYSLAFGPIFTASNATITFNTTTANASVGAITNGTTLTKNGAGSLTLTASNAYTGTNLNAGTLVVDNAGGLGNNGATVNIAGPATLALASDTAFGTTGKTYNVNVGGGGSYAGTIALGRATAGSMIPINHNFGTLTVSLNGGGAGQLNITAGPNAVTNGVDTASFTSLTFGNNNSAFDTLNPTGGNIVINGNAAPYATPTNNYTATLDLDGTTSGNVINGVISNSVSGSFVNTAAINKTNTSTWTLNGTNTYTGATNITGGILALGANSSTNTGASLGSTAVTVTNATLAVTPGAAAAASGNALGGTLTLNSNSNFTMVDGATSTFNVAMASSLAPATGISPVLSFDIGSSGVSDQLSIGGTATIGAANDVINVIDIGGAGSIGQTYTVINAAGGLSGSGTFALGTDRVNIGGSYYSLSLGNSGGMETVTVGAIPLAPVAYWTGGQSSTWNSPASSPTNWSSDAGGVNDLNTVPVATTDVYFTATAGAGGMGSPGNLTNTLGANTTINSLNFTTGSPSITVANDGNTLTINNGGVTNASSNPQAINTPVALGGAQTWTNNGGTLTFGGGVTAGGYPLTFAGSGATTISGSTAFTTSAGVTVNSNSGAITISSPVTLGAPQTWTNNSTNVLTVGGYGNAITNGGNTLTTAGTGNFALAGSLMGTGGLTVSGTGVVTLSASNNYTGQTIVRGGVLAVPSGGSITSTSILDLGGAGGAVLAISGGSVTTAVGANVRIGMSGATNPNSIGTLYLTSGSLTAVSDSNFGFVTTTGTVATGYGYQTGGTFTQSGGAFYVGVLVASGTATGTYSISGGALNTGNAEIGGGGSVGGATSTLNVSGTAAVSFGAVNTANATSSTINIDGGTLATQAWTTGATNTHINFDGGTLKANAASATFLGGGTNAVNLYAASGTINTNGNNITIVRPFQDVANSSLASVSVTDNASVSVTDNIDVFSAPTAVTFTGATGTNATGYTVLDSNGHVTGVVITNAGSFTGTETGVTIAGATPADVIFANTSSPVIAANSAGGLTKTGAGVLTLSGSSTYGGGTNIQAGTLAIASTGSLSPTGAMNIANTGTLQLGDAANPLSQTFPAITGMGTVIGGNAANNSTLTINTGTPATFSGILGGTTTTQNNLGLTKTGSGVLTLTGYSTNTGPTVVTSGTLQLGAPAAPTGQSLLLHLDGNTTDSSGNGNNATLVNSPGYTTGISGQAISLNGSNQYATVQYNSSLNLTGAYTVSLWEKLNAAVAPDSGSGPALFSTRNGGDTTFDIQITNTGLHGDIGNGAGTWLTTGANATVSLGTTWNMVTYTASTTGYAIYVNGAQVVSGGYTTGGTPELMKTGQILSLGSQEAGGPFGSAGWFNGALDDVNVFPSALSANQVAELYTYTSGLNQVLSPAAPLTVAAGATFDLNGVNQTVASLSDSTPGSGGLVINSASFTPATLTLNTSGSATFTGIIGGDNSNNPISVVMNGTGMQILAGANTYTGGTTVNSGTLQLGSALALGSSNGLLTVNGGTLDLYGFSATANGLSGSGGNITSSNGSSTLTVNSDGQSYAGTISGPVALVINGTASQTLAGSNSYTGGTIVNGGTVYSLAGSSLGTGPLAVNNLNSGNGSAVSVYLSASAPTTVGSLSGSITNSAGGNAATIINDGQLFTVNQTTSATYAGTITGGGGFTLGQSSTSTLTLTGSNSYSGPTTINAGTLVAGNASALGTNTSAIAIGSASGSSDAGLLIGGAYTVANGINTVAGTTGTLTIGGTTDNNATFSGAITLNNSLTVSQAANTGTNSLNLTGGITGGSSGPTTVTFSGPGNINVSTNPISDDGINTVAVAVSGGLTTLNTANNYSGGTTVSGGTLLLGNASALGSVTSPAVTVNGGTLDLGGYAPTINGLASSITGGTVTSSSGTPTLTIATANNASYSGAIAGPLAINITGSGSQAFAGPSTYSGNTAVMGGTLFVNTPVALGSGTGTGNVSVNSGARLGGTGNIGGNVSIASGATISPGATNYNYTAGTSGTSVMPAAGDLGTLTTAGNQTWNGGGTYLFKTIVSTGTGVTGDGQDLLGASGTATAITGQDFVMVGGTLDIEASSGTPFIINIVHPTGTPVSSGVFIIANASAVDIGGSPVMPAVGVDGTSVTQDFTVEDNGVPIGASVDVGVVSDTSSMPSYDVQVNVPEPGSLGLLGVASLGLLRRRRRVNKQSTI